MALSCITSEIKQDIGRKSWLFHTPLHLTPPEYCHLVWYWKTRMVGLPDGEKNCEDMRNRIDTILACGRRTERQTSCHGIVHAMHMRRGVKIGQWLHRSTKFETTSPYAPRSSRLGSEPPCVEGDVDIWCYAVLELHARNDDEWLHENANECPKIPQS